LIDRPVNCLPLSISTSSVMPKGQRLHERQTHRPAGGPAHHRSDHAVPGMVIHPG
jgi:hypothetical protein